MYPVDTSPGRRFFRHFRLSLGDIESFPLPVRHCNVGFIVTASVVAMC